MSAYIGVKGTTPNMISSLEDGDFFKTVQGAQGQIGSYGLTQSTSIYTVKSPEYREICIWINTDNIPVQVEIKVDGILYYQNNIISDIIDLPTPILDNFTLTVSDVSIFSSANHIAFATYDSKAHNISKAYIGVPIEKTKDVPRQETTTTTKTISCTVNDANTASQYKKLSDLFTITNGSSYYFANTNTESTNNYSTYKSNNSGHNSTTASTTLTALHDFSALSFRYSYSGEKNYDYVTLTVGGTTIESKASGSTTNKTWSGTLSKGQTIEITYTKDRSQNSYDDCGTIYNIQATYQATVTETTTVIDKVGAGEYVNLARKVKKAYIGDNNGKARLCFAGKTPFIIGKITFDVSPTYNIKIENIPFKPYKAFILYGMYRSNGKLATIADNYQQSVVGAYEDKVFYTDGNLFKVSDKNSMQVIYGDNYVEVQAGDKQWVLGEYTYVIIGESEEPDNIAFLSQMSNITGKFTNLKFTPINGMGIIIDSSGNTGGHYKHTEIFSSPTVKGNSFIDEYVIGIRGQSGSDYITFNTNSATFNGSFLGDTFYAVVWKS